MKLIKKIYFKQKRKILNYLIHNFTFLYRPSSEPYISGDTFRKHADHVYDESKKFNPKNVKINDIVFLSANLIDEYFYDIHKKIKNKYILISHNSDRNITEKDRAYIDDKIIFWYAQNLSIKQNKFIGSIPIGLENLRFQLNGVLNDFIEKPSIKNQNKILASFSIATNPEKRENLMKIAKNNTIIDVKNFANHKSYFEGLQLYKFNLCPEGNGLDTHRIWESLLVKTIPVMEDSVFTKNLASLNFPILVLESWQDLNDLSSKDLENIYKDETEKKQFDEVVKLEYWINFINRKKIVY